MVPTTSKITLRDYLQETDDAISSGRIDDALAKCQLVLTQFPESLEAQRLLGEAYLKQGNLEDARNAFDWVLTNDPENVVAYCDRALISESMSDYDTALDCYQQAYELSRGNGQIRSKFNQLSARTGQQGFMFSRAGLARLYMRGDMLSQALQEWDVVLAATPDRLDARTGLLETYWREGLYDQVERLASQILQEVPGCLKALLLLAYVTTAKDVQQARMLLERAEALDPDLVMAQELFADMLASQPADPFLQLLKRPPAVLDASRPAGMNLTEMPTIESPVLPVQDAYALSNGTSNTPAMSGPANASSPWGGGETWGTDVTLIKPKQQEGAETWGTDVTLIKPKQQEGAETWGSDMSLLSPQSGTSSQHANADIPIWTSDVLSQITVSGSENTPQDVDFRQDLAHSDASLNSSSVPSDPWSSLAQTPANQEESQLEPWQLLEKARNNVDAADQDQASGRDSQSWESMSGLHRLAETKASYEDVSTWEGLQDNQSAVPETPGNASSSIWGVPAKEEGMSAAPDWLNMLQAERQQTSDAPSFPSSLEQKASVEQPVSQQPAFSPSDVSPRKQQESEAVLSISEDDEEELSFGPEWLKSLGAATLESEDVKEPTSAEVSQPVVSQHAEPEPVHEPQKAQKLEPRQKSVYESWTMQTPMPEVQPARIADGRSEPAYEVWSSQVAEPEAKTLQEIQSSQATESSPEAVQESWRMQTSESAEKIEQNLLTTLEELEQDLLSKGFVPLEPNTLSTIAQSEGVMPPTTTVPETPSPVSEQGTQEPTLSSALAQLGNFAQSPAMQDEAPGMPVQPASTSEMPTTESRWTAAFRPVPEPTPPPFVPQVTPDQNDTPTVAIPRAATRTPQGTPVPTRVEAPRGQQGSSTVPPARIDTTPRPVFESTPPPPSMKNKSQEAPKIPTTPADPLLDNELETTMRRPAVRLQPMQQRPMPRDMAPVRRRSGERPASNTADGNLSSQERLVRGYQHQLAGDYDAAMQEYRIIIRTAPELIAEVVSNVRALLKIAPRYSAGYRVLGDAYMRQGEYLQAMESYNKALTMAKKARG